MKHLLAFSLGASVVMHLLFFVVGRWAGNSFFSSDDVFPESTQESILLDLSKAQETKEKEISKYKSSKNIKSSGKVTEEKGLQLRGEDRQSQSLRHQVEKQAEKIKNTKEEKQEEQFGETAVDEREDVSRTEPQETSAQMITENSEVMKLHFEDAVKALSIGSERHMYADFFEQLLGSISRGAEPYTAVNGGNLFVEDSAVFVMSVDYLGDISFVRFIKKSSVQSYMNYFIKGAVENAPPVVDPPKALFLRSDKRYFLCEIKYTGPKTSMLFFTIY
jgi:hypothetical protein